MNPWKTRFGFDGRNTHAILMRLISFGVELEWYFCIEYFCRLIISTGVVIIIILK